ncbi:hypothetical protein [Cellulosimicrobium sp. CUA-896]|uniref:hypothetical protein n=1 Tax=Cellulosimicrobium sp. CUA-896 TaxID=1517881 RepID=UPI00210088D7|nr:hypothetical protein [Cellulosimicrobium sp. CUA-896]
MIVRKVRTGDAPSERAARGSCGSSAAALTATTRTQNGNVTTRCASHSPSAEPTMPVRWSW